ncbi:MAG: hypothetical protein C0456_13320 [Hyphomonas sp.]|nr:hypothetical protein [Hyphomonas sp.]
MQGRWVDIDDASTELAISGGEITCFGRLVEYDFKTIEEIDGALTVSLSVNDTAKLDSFQRENITELVLTPEGDFHAYNVKFATQFIQANK